MLLTKTFSPEHYRDALESWTWIGLGGKTPVLSSLFGDTFLQDQDGYWFLDTIERSLTPIFERREELQAALDTEEGQDRFLLGGLALAAERRGVVLAANEVYTLAPHPIVGGPFDPANIMAMDFVVALHLAGQLHDQVRSMPPGTEISGFTIDRGEPSAEPAPPRRRWRRR